MVTFVNNTLEVTTMQMTCTTHKWHVWSRDSSVDRINDYATGKTIDEIIAGFATGARVFSKASRPALRPT